MMDATCPLKPPVTCDYVEPKRFRHLNLPFFITSAVLIISGSNLAQSTEFIGLGDLDGGKVSSWASGVSADGKVVVGGSYSGFGREPIRWTAASGMESIGFLSGGAFTGNASAASADGSVIVGYDDTNYLEFNAFRWSANGGKQFLEPPQAPRYEDDIQYAVDVSASGNVVVGNYLPAPGAGLSPYRWTIGGGTVPLGGFTASGVSADGRVIAGSSWSNGADRAASWTENDGWMPLGISDEEDRYSLALAASADGRVIVGEDNSSTIYPTAFRWASDDDVIFLTDPTTGQHSTAYDVSANGKFVVGAVGPYIISGSISAYVWNENRGMRLLADILTARGIDLVDWNLSAATGISADGSIIVGYGEHGDGTREAWMADISVPVPPAFWLFSTGILSLIGIARKKNDA